MNKINIFLCLIVTSFGLSLHAQVKILSRFIQKTNTLKHCSYTAITDNTSPFGDNADTIQIYQETNPVLGLQFEFTTKHEQDFFDGKKLLKLNFTNKFFSVQDNYKWANSLLSSIPVFVIADIIKKTTKTPEKIRPLPDTLINKIACSHIRIVKSDSLLRNKRSYDIVDIYLNKATLFPVYAVHDQQGYISKGGVSSDDVFRLTERSRYLGYDFNKKRKIDLELVKIPADFITMEAYNNKSSDKPLPLLSAGSKAPEWKLQDTKGNSFSSNSVQNKVLLIDFFGNYCAPCIMSLPAINRLQERYKDADVEIVSVDLDNGRRH